MVGKKRKGLICVAARALKSAGGMASIVKKECTRRRDTMQRGGERVGIVGLIRGPRGEQSCQQLFWSTQEKEKRGEVGEEETMLGAVSSGSRDK